MPRQRSDQLRFWLGWLLACALGTGLGWALGWTIDTALAEDITAVVRRSVEDFALQHMLQRTLNGAVIGGVLGLTVGLAQWLVLRARLQRAAPWLASSAAGWGIGWPLAQTMGRTLASTLQQSIGWPSSSDEIALLVGAVAGLIIGGFQWLALRRQVRHAGGWVAASIAAGAVLWALSGLVGRSLSLAEQWLIAEAALSWGIGGAAAGGLSGLAAARLTR